MQLVQQIIIKRKSELYPVLDALCYKTKNVYNYTLYLFRQNYIQTGKFLFYYDLDKLLRMPEHRHVAEGLPAQTTQQILRLFEGSVKGFIALCKAYKTSRITHRPGLPRYKHKTSGRHVAVFTSQQVKLRDVFIHFPKATGIPPLKTTVTGKLNQVRVVPRKGRFVIEVVYTVSDVPRLEPNDNVLSIDLGVVNVVTAYNTVTRTATLYKEPGLKQNNQYYNKRKASLQSQLKKRNGKFTSNQLQRLTNKRNNQIKDALHKLSRTIVKNCVETGVTQIVVGHDTGWKSGVDLGNGTNQKFVQIPHSQLIQMIEYKAAMAGITVHVVKESYTSRCSALDLEPIQRHKVYAGRRVNRGLFVTAGGERLNADVNAALNILRKALPSIGDSHCQLLQESGWCRQHHVNSHRPSDCGHITNNEPRDLVPSRQ